MMPYKEQKMLSEQKQLEQLVEAERSRELENKWKQEQAVQESRIKKLKEWDNLKIEELKESLGFSNDESYDKNTFGGINSILNYFETSDYKRRALSLIDKKALEEIHMFLASEFLYLFSSDNSRFIALQLIVELKAEKIADLKAHGGGVYELMQEILRSLNLNTNTLNTFRYISEQPEALNRASLVAAILRPSKYYNKLNYENDYKEKIDNYTIGILKTITEMEAEKFEKLKQEDIFSIKLLLMLFKDSENKVSAFEFICNQPKVLKIITESNLEYLASIIVQKLQSGKTVNFILDELVTLLPPQKEESKEKDKELEILRENKSGGSSNNLSGIMLLLICCSILAVIAKSVENDNEISAQK